MRLTLYLTLAVVPAALLGVAALEVVESRPPVTAPGPAASRLLPAIPRPAAIRDTEKEVRAILARPLFATTRRPPLRHTATAVSSEQALPRLTGVLVSPWSRSAIFQPAKAKAVVVREGDVVAGWTVRSIAADAITLARADQLETITPRFDGETGAKITPPPLPHPPDPPRPTTGVLLTRWSDPHLQP